MRKAIEKKLKELQDLDIIEDVDGPTPWVSPLVAVPKSNGDIRVCVDVRRVNEAILLERHPIPTLEETLQDLNGATVFSKLDLRWGYHQVELHPESRVLTTFSTHMGLKRYKRLIFGLSSASEIYQYVIQEVLQGIPGARNISDDIIVFGKTQEIHDEQLEITISRLAERGLTLNREKCVFSVPELVFFGHKVSAAGISPDERKVDAVNQARAPQNISELRSFLGLANYCARYISHFATIVEPLRHLTRAGVKWSWTSVPQKAFDSVKSMLTSDCPMSHFDPSAETQLKVDASPFGLGAVLLQGSGDDVRPIAYASRTLTDVERRYSQTEREALAVVWACERFHIYLFGQEFKLYTDHKALEVIYSPRSKPPSRIERWSLRLQPYRFTIHHMPGQHNPTDVLSRMPLTNQPCRERDIAEEYIHYVAVRAVPKAFFLEQISAATKDDKVLQQVKKALNSGQWPNDKEINPFQKLKDELSTSQGLVLRGSRIVPPECLRANILKSAHQGHQGIVRTKQMVREKVWWPGIDREIELMIKSCLPCQSMAPKAAPEPLRPTTMPNKPWQDIHIDLCGPFPTGESLLVCEDACTRWPEVVILKTTTSAVIISHLKRIFAAQGIPMTVVSDNGPQFVSEEFEAFLRDYGINHRKVTTYWPQANVQVERFNRTLEKAIRGAHVEGKDCTFLLNYRATPHATTNVSPAVLHLGREIRTKVPQLEVPVSESLESALQNAHLADANVKQRMAVYTDAKKKAKPSVVEVDDKVLLQQNHQNKLSTRYDPNSYTVIERRGPGVVLQRDEETPIMRNVSLVHKIPNEVGSKEEDVDVNVGSAENPVDDQGSNGSEEDGPENEDGMHDIGGIQPHIRPARQVRAPSYLRDFRDLKIDDVASSTTRCSYI